MTDNVLGQSTVGGRLNEQQEGQPGGQGSGGEVAPSGDTQTAACS